MQAAPTAAIVLRFDVLSSQMLIWYSLYIFSLDLILWAISLVFAHCNIVPERFLMFCFLTLHVFYRSWSNCLANCCCRQAVVVVCLVLLVSQKCVCFCLYCLLNMLVLNSICLAAWQLHICLRIYCLLCYRWRQLEMAGLLVFLTAAWTWIYFCMSTFASWALHFYCSVHYFHCP